MVNVEKMKLLLLLFAIIRTVNGHHLEKCSLRQIDICLIDFYHRQFGVPTDELELRRSCFTTNTMFRCLTSYFQRCFPTSIQKCIFYHFHKCNI